MINWKIRKWILAVGVVVIANYAIANNSLFGIGVAIAFSSLLVDDTA